MASTLNLSGLASGVDTSSIVDQLMAIERQPRVRLQWRQAAVEARQNALKDVDTRLGNLLNAAKALRDAVTWADSQTITSSDPTKVSAKRLSTAPAGPAAVDVIQLATNEQRTYAYTQKSQATTITIGSASIAIDANADVNRAADQINAAANSPVYASVSNGNLVLVSKTIGTPGAFTASGQGNQLQEQTSLSSPAKDATYKVNGATYTSTTNVTTVGLPGVELTLLSVGTSTINVSVPGPDKNLVKDKLKAFVDQYNSTVDFIKSKLEERKVANPANQDDAIKGVLYADSGLNSLLSQLREGVSDVISNGNPATVDELAEIGVSTGGFTGGGTFSKDAVEGRLVFDETKFNAAFDASSANVKRLLGGVSGTDGFAQRIEGFINPVTQTGGLIDIRQDGATAELKRIKDSMDAMDTRLALKEERLKAQFAAMETLLSQSQAQSQWLAGQITGLMAPSG